TRSSRELLGDWYACCRNGLSGPEAQIPCKEKSNRTLEEQALVDSLKNHSKVIGSSILLAILFLAVCWSAIEWRKCREKTCTCCDRIILYELVILEQQEEVLKDIWMEKAKKDLTTKIQTIMEGKKEGSKTQKCSETDKKKESENQNETKNIERRQSTYAACCDA
ncbi:hypothetical protein ILYODFUR_039014, partial [Ilyodon furcidens]